MKRLTLLWLFFAFKIHMYSQCFEIQSILVDACDGSNEGRNEMVTFQVGNSALNTANLSVTWPNNSWLGICQSASTATSVAYINSTIQACGYLKEPVGGVLPAHSKVLLITSVDFNPSAQSFVNLSDTLYVIFQCSGNTQGHFVNYSSTPGIRTLSMSFSSPSGCSDAVSYDRSLLINQSGTHGAQDGGAVNYDAAGNATYVNYGCAVPIQPLSVDAGNDVIICENSTTNLSASASGQYNSVFWSLGSGATGTLSSVNTLTTSYTSGSGDLSQIKLYCTIIKSCIGHTITTTDSINVFIREIPQFNISSSQGYSLCPGITTSMSYSITNSAYTPTYTTAWNNPASSSPTYSISSPSGTSSVTYSLSLTNSCGTTTQTFEIVPLPSPSVSLTSQQYTACPNSSVTIIASSPNNNYQWSSSSATSSSISLSSNTTTTGVVTTTNSCGSASDSYTLTIVPIPTISVSPSTVLLCGGQTETITATSNVSTYTWTSGSNNNSITVNNAGVETVSVSNLCGNASASATITVGSTPSISLTTSSSTLCPNQTATLSIIGSSGSYTWNDNSSGSSLLVNTSGIYSATVTNSCGTNTASINISGEILPIVSVTSNTAMVCSGQSVLLSASSTINDYQWSNGASTNTTSVNSAGTYTVNSTNICGTSQQTISVTSMSAPSLTIVPSSAIVCPGSEVTLTVYGGNTPYNWSLTSNTGNTVTCGPGTFTVGSTNACGSGTATITIIEDNIQVSFTASPQSGIKPLIVSFNNTSSNTTTYSWNFGNGNTSNSTNPGNETYNSAGTYSVILVGTSSNGCTGYDTVIINVQEAQPWIEIPNVFTPNSDMVNDLFLINHYNITDMDVVIYDRWGLEMTHWNSLNGTWDGKVNGKNVPDGTYFFLLQATDVLGNNIKKQGAFSLLR